MATTVTAKGQVTIPKPVRDLLGIGPGSKVDFLRSEDGSIVLVPAGTVQAKGRFSGLRGHAGKGMSTDAILNLTRGEA